MRRAVRVAEVALVAALWTLLLLGVSVSVLTAPAFTRVLVTNQDAGTRTGLGERRALDAAEDVRAFVASPRPDPLPATVDGRPAFDASAVSHLRDVRAVIAAGRVATGAAAGLLAVWLLWCVARARWVALARGLRWGGLTAVGLTASAAFVALVGFDRFFAGFHTLFFEPGTWVFPSDSLLIRLFPEQFWVAAAAAWAALVALGGAVLGAASRRMRPEAWGGLPTTL